MGGLKDWLGKFNLPWRKPEGAELSSAHEQTVSQDPYAFQASHRRLAWMLRLAVAVIVIEGLIVLTLGNIISVVVPLKEVRIALLRTDPADDRIYRVEPLSRNVPGFDLVMEARAKRMVSLLLTIDSVTQAERFNEAFKFTSDAYYEKFRSARFDMIEDAIESGLNRSIVVESVSPIESDGGFYKYAVDFTQTDKRKGKQLSIKNHRAYLSLTTRPQDVKEADKYENPLGVILVDMAVKEKKESSS